MLRVQVRVVFEYAQSIIDKDSSLFSLRTGSEFFCFALAECFFRPRRKPVRRLLFVRLPG